MTGDSVPVGEDQDRRLQKIRLPMASMTGAKAKEIIVTIPGGKG